MACPCRRRRVPSPRAGPLTSLGGPGDLNTATGSEVWALFYNIKSFFSGSRNCIAPTHDVGAPLPGATGVRPRAEARVPPARPGAQLSGDTWCVKGVTLIVLAWPGAWTGRTQCRGGTGVWRALHVTL